MAAAAPTPTKVTRQGSNGARRSKRRSSSNAMNGQGTPGKDTSGGDKVRCGISLDSQSFYCTPSVNKATTKYPHSVFSPPWLNTVFIPSFVLSSCRLPNPGSNLSALGYTPRWCSLDRLSVLFTLVTFLSCLWSLPFKQSWLKSCLLWHE